MGKFQMNLSIQENLLMFEFNLILYKLEAMTTQIAVNMVKKFYAPVKNSSQLLSS